MTLNKLFKIISANHYALRIGSKNEPYEIVDIRYSNQIIAKISKNKRNQFKFNTDLIVPKILNPQLLRAIKSFSNTPKFLRFDKNLKHVLFG